MSGNAMAAFIGNQTAAPRFQFCTIATSVPTSLDVHSRPIAAAYSPVREGTLEVRFIPRCATLHSVRGDFYAFGDLEIQ